VSTPGALLQNKMVNFQYKAMTPDGSVVRGQVEATDRQTAVARLQAQGHLLLSLEIAPPITGLRALLSREVGGHRRRGPRLVAELVGRVALLLEAGVALEGALALLAGSEGTIGIRDRAAALLRRLRAGAGLGEAMAAEKNAYPPVVIAMVRAGETSGTLAPTLGRLAEHLARAEAVRQSIRSAMIYPAVLLVTALGAVLLVLLVVLPQLEPVFLEAGDRLPLLTQLAFVASRIMRGWWWILLALLMFAILGAWRLLKEPTVRARLDMLALRAPVLGMTIRRAEAGRFARVLGTLLSGGVILPIALQLALPALGNQLIADRVGKVIAAVREGGGLARPLAHVDAFPDLAVQMIRIGEATGKLDAMLLRLADLLEADVQRTINRALSLLVPSLTICLGGLVAGIIASVMLAVLGINDLLH
jgi:general secretion pathway protein F